jgi:hypothetical protein
MSKINRRNFSRSFLQICLFFANKSISLAAIVCVFLQYGCHIFVAVIVNRIDGLETHLNKYKYKSGRSPSRAYCIFAQLTNSMNVLGKLPIRDSNNREN